MRLAENKWRRIERNCTLWLLFWGLFKQSQSKLSWFWELRRKLNIQMYWQDLIQRSWENKFFHEYFRKYGCCKFKDQRLRNCKIIILFVWYQIQIGSLSFCISTMINNIELGFLSWLYCDLIFFRYKWRLFCFWVCLIIYIKIFSLRIWNFSIFQCLFISWKLLMINNFDKVTYFLVCRIL